MLLNVTNIYLIFQNGIIVHYPRKPKTSSGVGSAAFKSKGLRQALINRSCLELEKDCRKIVRKKKSVLKCTFLEDLRKFRWSKLMKEWIRQVPTHQKVLRAISVPPQFAKRKMQSLRHIIATAGAMLLKARNAQMCAVQYHVGLSLFLGQARKKVCFKIFHMIYYCSCKNMTSILHVAMYKSFVKGILCKCICGLMKEGLPLVYYSQ